jgi:GPH family glycoside/pentoside/hexuronide:cation symporter
MSKRTDAAPVHDLPQIAIIGWGLGTLPMAILFNSFNILALRYFVDYVGLAAAAAGSLIALSKIYDAVTDPLMGTISDRTRSRFGRRRIYLLIGGLLCALVLIALFSIPSGLDSGVAFALVALVVFLYATGYTVYTIPYIAMAAEISASSHTRASMMSWRVLFIGLGGLLAGTLGPKIIAWAGGGASGHFSMAIVLGSLVMLFAVLTFLMTSRTPKSEARPETDPMPLREKLRTIAQNRPFLILLSLKLFQLTGVAMASGTLAFFTVWILGRGYADLGSIVFWTTAGQVIGTPLFLAFMRRTGKRAAFVVAAIIFAVTSLSWLAADAAEPMWIIALRVFIKGIATAGILLVGQVLLPDTIEYDRQRTGLRREGVLSGMYTTIEKVAFAGGAAITGLYLDWMGYVPGLQPASGAQPATAIQAIQYCQSVIPAVFIMLAAACLAAYRLPSQVAAPARGSA